MKNYQNMFKEEGLPFGRMVGESKSGYRDKNPKNKVVFNARIYLKKYWDKEKNGEIQDFFGGMEHQIWYGDLDLTLDTEKLLNVVKKNKLHIVIAREHGEYVTQLGG